MSESDKVLREIERMAEHKFLPIVGPRRGQVLVEAVRRIKPKSVLEVGTLIGYSAVLMAKEMEPSAHLITVEIHEEEARTARENIGRAKVSPAVEVIVGNAIEVIPGLRGKFDLVFIDAEKSEYLAYLRLIEPKLHEGSTLVADNAGIFAREMKDYLDYVRSSKKYSTRYVPVDNDGLEVSMRL